MTEQKFNFSKFMNVYKFETNLLGTGQKIIFKPITINQMKELLQYEDVDNPLEVENILDQLIKDCIISPEDFEIENMFLQDKAFLLYEIRRKTKGNFYEFNYKCPNCKSQSLQKIDISLFNKTKFDKTKNNQIRINDNIHFKMKHLTRKEQKEILEIVDGMFKEEEKEIEEKAKIEDMTEKFERLQMKKAIEAGFLSNAYSIESILSPSSKSKKTLIEENDIPVFTKKELLESLSEQEFENIKKWLDENDFGVDFKFEIICPHCENKEEKELPVENFFL